MVINIVIECVTITIVNFRINFRFILIKFQVNAETWLTHSFILLSPFLCYWITCYTYKIKDIVKIVLIISLWTFITFKEDERQKIRASLVYIYTVCYISILIYNLWFFSLVPMDSGYHLVSFSYSNSSLFTPSSLHSSCEIYYICLYVRGPTIHFIPIVLYNCLLNQLREEKRQICIYMVFCNTRIILSHVFLFIFCFFFVYSNYCVRSFTFSGKNFL